MAYSAIPEPLRATKSSEAFTPTKICLQKLILKLKKCKEKREVQRFIIYSEESQTLFFHQNNPTIRLEQWIPAWA